MHLASAALFDTCLHYSGRCDHVNDLSIRRLASLEHLSIQYQEANKMISLEFLLASAIGLLTATGVYLILRARTFPVVLGLAMIGYAVNLFLFVMGRITVNAPAVLTETTQPDPTLYHKHSVLTAIVIGFATTAFIVQLSLRSRYETGTDHVNSKRRNTADQPTGGEPND